MSDSQHIADVTGVILAGGSSRRMEGVDKALLEIDGQSLFERVLEVFRQLFDRILIAGDRPDLASEDVPCVPDVYPGSSLGGLHAGLAGASTPHVFAAACDMPHVDPAAIRYLLQRRHNCDVVVPETPQGFEPLFAVYSRGCLPHMETMLRAGRCRIYDFYPRVNLCRVPAGELPGDWRRTLANVNTPEQWQEMQN